LTGDTQQGNRDREKKNNSSHDGGLIGCYQERRILTETRKKGKGLKRGKAEEDSTWRKGGGIAHQHLWVGKNQ